MVVSKLIVAYPPERFKFEASKAEDENTYPIMVILQHLADEEATPHQNLSSTATDGASNGSAPQNGLFRVNLAADDDTDDLIQKAREKTASTEIVKADYIIGCDGAHSWRRWQLGFEMDGEQTDLYVVSPKQFWT